MRITEMKKSLRFLFGTIFLIVVASSGIALADDAQNAGDNEDLFHQQGAPDGSSAFDSDLPSEAFPDIAEDLNINDALPDAFPNEEDLNNIPDENLDLPEGTEPLDSKL